MTISPVSSQVSLQNIASTTNANASRMADPDRDGDVDAQRTKAALPSGQGQLVDVDA